MANRIYIADSGLAPVGVKETFTYRMKSDAEKGEFQADFVQYAETADGDKAAVSDFANKVGSIAEMVNKALRVEVQGATSSKAGKDKRTEQTEKVKTLKAAEQSADPKIKAALELIRSLGK